MKRLLTVLCCLAFMLLLIPTDALAAGEGNIDQGGGNMGQGTSQNKWSPETTASGLPWWTPTQAAL